MLFPRETDETTIGNAAALVSDGIVTTTLVLVCDTIEHTWSPTVTDVISVPEPSPAPVIVTVDSPVVNTCGGITDVTLPAMVLLLIEIQTWLYQDLM